MVDGRWISRGSGRESQALFLAPFRPSFKSAGGVVPLFDCLAPLPCVSVNELAQSSLGLSNQAIDTWPVLEESS